MAKKCCTALFGLILWPYLSWADVPQKTPSVYVRPALQVELFDQLTYPAKVAPQMMTSLLAETDGVVVAVPAALGAKVKKGNPLVVLKHTDPVYQFAPMRVRAPLAGVVSSVNVTLGTQVIRGQSLVTLTDPSQTQITVEIPAGDLPLLSAGSVGEFLGPDGKSIEVMIRGVSPFVDPATGTALAELKIVTGTPLIGTVGRVTFKANIRNGIEILESALVFKEGKTFVNIVNDGKAKRVEAKLGRKQRGRVEILEGLKPNDSVVERSSGYIDDGQVVTVEAAKEAPSSPGTSPAGSTL